MQTTGVNQLRSSSCVLGNITTYFSDHVPQFLVIENSKQASFKQSPLFKHSPFSFRDYKNVKRPSKQNYVSLIGDLLQREF